MENFHKREPIMINFEEKKDYSLEIITNTELCPSHLNEKDVKTVDLKLRRKFLNSNRHEVGTNGGRGRRKKVVDWQKIVPSNTPSLTFDEIKKLTLPPLNALWDELDEEIKRQYKLAGFEVQVDTEVTTEQDINELMQFFGY